MPAGPAPTIATRRDRGVDDMAYLSMFQREVMVESVARASVQCGSETSRGTEVTPWGVELAPWVAERPSWVAELVEASVGWAPFDRLRDPVLFGAGLLRCVPPWVAELVEASAAYGLSRTT